MDRCVGRRARRWLGFGLVALSPFVSVRTARAEGDDRACDCSGKAAPGALQAPLLGQDVPSPAPVDYNASGASRTAGNYLWPLVDVIAVNLALWSVPRVIGSPFAQISPSSWKANLNSGFQWDDNEFEVNQFFHPYQGGLYYSSARVNGLNFWESALYTVFGSVMWEYFMETEQPSTNDLMTTTWGGVFFGEALYRLSNYVRDDTASGSTRFWKEFGTFATNPINGLDRLVTRSAWREGPPGKRPHLGVDLRVGADGLGLSEGTGWGKTFRTWIRFDYGDPYEERPTIGAPFEVFNLSLQLSASSSIFGQGVDGTGVLAGQRFSIGGADQNLFAWVLGYEYFTNGTTKMTTRDSNGVYQLGEMGTGPSWFARWPLGGGLSVETELDLLAVPTGAITSPYAKYEANRSYNYGVGGALKGEVDIRYRKLGRFYVIADRYLYYIVDGARGIEHVGTLQIGAFANLYRGHGLGLTAIRYDRNSYYDDYADLFDNFWSGQLHYEVEF